MLTTTHWEYLHGRPTTTGVLKQQAEDFIVREQLGFSPSGAGEHIYLWLRKEGLNTAYVAEQLAAFTQLPLRNISYAGRKDKHAVTEQWFGVHKPGKTDYDWQQFTLPGAEILHSSRHHKKLRTGVLKGNSFEIVIRQLSATQDLTERLEQIATQGVPNYFGQQRFGDTRHQANGGNLALAEKMLQGEVIRNRNKRSMAISALRSWLFNEFVSQRLAEHKFHTPMSGEVMQLAGSNSIFVCTEADETILQRLTAQDINITAPMWGQGELLSQSETARWEKQQADKQQQLCAGLAQLGLQQERRAVRLYPQNMHWKIEADRLTIAFTLPSGCFATSVIRELVNLA